MRGTTSGTRRVALGCSLLLVLATTGCAATAHPRDGTRLQTASRSGSAAAATPPSDDAPTGATSSAQALAVAEHAAVRFCRPELNRQAWITDLDPLLTLAAANAYGTVQPSRVACTRVTATAHPGEGDDFTRLVTVPTDAGPYRITVTRASVSERWLVFRIAPVTAQ